MTDPFEVVLNLLDGVRRNGDAAMARCPVHGDSTPSLSVKRGDKGVVLTCFAGCSLEAITTELGIPVSELFYERRQRSKVTAEYPYRDEHGQLLYTVRRVEPGRNGARRDFYQVPASGHTGPGAMRGVRRVLYRLPEVLAAAAAGEPVYIAEGEKDVDSLVRVGCCATTNPRGAGKWGQVPDAAEVLTDVEVIIVADRDEPGRRHAAGVANSLLGRAAEISVVEPVIGKDVSDHLAAGHDVEELEVVASTIDDLMTGGTVAMSTWLSGCAVDFPKGDKRVPRNEDDASTPGSDAIAQPSLALPPTYAHDQHVLARFGRDVRRCGVVGEESVARILYLLITSRLLDKPVSAAVKGHSSSGKSFVTEQTVRFFPSEAVVVMTAMSEKALVYSTEEFVHRTLILYEAVALREGTEDNLTAYFVRSLLSEGRIEYPVTVRGSDGNWVTKTITKEGPTNMVFTTTRTRVHAENETRVLSLSTDDSRAQTARVFEALADEAEHSVDFAEWHALQGWLQSTDNRVTIPFAAQLAKMVPPVAVRLRRDFGALLALIRCHAIIHQLSRERDGDGQIIATIDGDYAMVRDLVANLIAEGVGATVADRVRQTVEVVTSTAGESGVTAVRVAKLLDVDKSTAGRRLREAADGGWIRNQEDRRGQPGRWVVGDPMPEQIEILPRPCCLAGGAQPCNCRCHETPSQGSGCAVAPLQEEERDEP